MKTIAFIVTEMETGGVSEALTQMLDRFDHDRYRVTLWVRAGTGIEQHRVDPRVEIRLWGEDSPILEPLITGQPLVFLKRAYHRFLGRCYIRHNDIHTFHCVQSLPALDTPCYDYVICYQGVSPLAIPNALYRIDGKERILWIHGDLGREGRSFRFCKKLYHRFHRAIAVSKSARDLFIEQYDYPIERTFICHNLIDAEKIVSLAEEPIDPPLKRPAIVTVGRLSPEKGQTMIPEAMRLLLKQGCDAYWYLIGDGCTRQQLQDEIRRLALEDRVILLGRKSVPFPYMKAADVYVQTSFSEGWCLTVQEARVLGKPVISTPVPAVMEQITHGKNGLICSDASPEALSASIATFLGASGLQQLLMEGPGPSSLSPERALERFYRFLEKQDQGETI